MTYIGLLAIIASIWAIVGTLYSLIRYLKVKRSFPGSYAAYRERSNIFWRILFPFINMSIFWLFSLLVVGLFCWDTPISTYTRTPVNTNEQFVIFKEQNNDMCIVSVSGKEYICTEIVIDSKIENLQVAFVDCEVADNFAAQFFFYEFIECNDIYELHIPASYLNYN